MNDWPVRACYEKHFTGDRKLEWQSGGAVIKNSLGEEFYKEAIEHCRSYNARLCAERSMRLPFLDSQTGVAQSNCYIWMEKNHRGPGHAPGQLYTYPARCWRKKRRLNILEDPRLVPIEFKIDYEASLKKEGGIPDGPVLESLLAGETLDKKVETKEEEPMSECQKLLVGDFPHELEVDEMEEDVPKRKNRTKARGVYPSVYPIPKGPSPVSRESCSYWTMADIVSYVQYQRSVPMQGVLYEVRQEVKKAGGIGRESWIWGWGGRGVDSFGIDVMVVEVGVEEEEEEEEEAEEK
ncbi:Zinc finger protein neuro-d4 [Larimichthys crocea]|uniref:Uncharacterized protein n=1 Tax=Larimichthys crocea TaxID=215358 RepID=A0ACD3QKN1_LARCR|nr:Zinc finger protein neuro-d4 [Larimichthys crocea]